MKEYIRQIFTSKIIRSIKTRFVFPRKKVIFSSLLQGLDNLLVPISYISCLLIERLTSVIPLGLQFLINFGFIICLSVRNYTKILQ